MKLCVCVCAHVHLKMHMHACSYMYVQCPSCSRTYFIRISGGVTPSNNIPSTDIYCVVCWFKEWKQGRTSSFRLITGHSHNLLVSSTTVNSNYVPNRLSELVYDLNPRLKKVLKLVEHLLCTTHVNKYVYVQPHTTGSQDTTICTAADVLL